MKVPFRWLTLLVSASFVCLPAHGHTGDELSGLSGSEVGFIYFRLGFEHILPKGLDHILFVVCLYLLNPKLKAVLWQATAFTVAHSITLGLAMYGWISPPPNIVEPAIALSIFFVAMENVLTDKLKPSRIIIIFMFGLIHGMGFAGVLTELGLPPGKYATALVTFNLGVEAGQIAVIVGMWLLAGIWFSQKPWYKKRVVTPISICIAAIALYWTIERAFFP